MPSYFRQVPDFEYVSRDPNQRQISEYATVKNLFRRGKLRDDIFGNLSYFTKYKIIGDERPDNVAFKLYNDETLDWVILLSNNILNIQTEWPLPQTVFDKVLLEKYGSYDELYNGIRHYETKEIRDSVGNLILPEGIKMPNQWKSANGFVEGYKGVDVISRLIYQGDVEVVIDQNLLDLKQNLEITIQNAVDEALNGSFVIKSIERRDIDEDGVDDQVRFRIDITGDVPTSGNGIELQVNGNESIEFISPEPLQQSNDYFYEYYDSNLQIRTLISSNSFLTPITNYEYESKIEDDKRNIFVLKPQYLNIVFNDMEEIMQYKKGSTQYVSRTLKRGENIRLFQ
jgi:hypothetical protein